MKVLELNTKHLKQLEMDIESPKGSLSRETSQDSNVSMLPDWMSRFHSIIIMMIVIFSLIGTVFWGVYPFLKRQQIDSDHNQLEEGFGFRTSILILHSITNASVFLAPFFIWYFGNSCKIEGFSQKELPYSQRSLYYSYSINQGNGQKIAALGIATSNIIYALIITSRFEFFKFINNERNGINKIAAISCLFIGLTIRVFASLVPSLPVHTHTSLHYLSAGLFFVSMGLYMTLETCFVDPSYEWMIKNDDLEQMFRRITSGVYWVAFICTGLFMKLELWAFSSIGELVALLASELYILTYLTSFRQLDYDKPYFDF